MASDLSPEHASTVKRVESAGHAYVLRWLDDLTEQQCAAFLDQLASVDFERVRELASLLGPAVAQTRAVTPDAVGPAEVERLPRTPDETERDQQAVRFGREALQQDRVAALVVAGGQGTRLGFDAPKGTFPITPVRNKTLFQVQAEKLLAARRRYGCRLPWLVMTSPTNDAETRAFFAEHDHFGLGEDSVHFFAQKVNPILSADGRMLLEQKGALMVGPDGHGGVFEALLASGVLDALQEAGHDLISYFQVDNPLVPLADERFLGHHLAREADFSCKVIPKRDPSEGLGVAVLREGRPEIVEYIDLPQDMANERTPEGELRYLFGSIAVHIVGAGFARRMGGEKDALPWHVARKKYAALDEQGQKSEQSPRECYKFERFVFDCLSHAGGCAFVEVDRADEFAPVKNAQGQDSPQSCREMMKAQWLRWLRAAGADTSALDAPDALLEISPLYACDADELAAQLPPRFRASSPTVLE